MIAVSCNFTNTRISLTGGTDYGGVASTVTFESGDTEQFVDITIVNDAVLEGVEMFTATLTTDDSNVDISSNDTAFITIVDDDSKLQGGSVCLLTCCCFVMPAPPSLSLIHILFFTGQHCSQKSYRIA